MSAGFAPRGAVAAAVVCLACPAAAGAASGGEPEVGPIIATFVRPTTTYTVRASSPGATLRYRWTKTGPRHCGKFSASGATAHWVHPDASIGGDCPNEDQHPALITVTITTADWRCRVEYPEGSLAGTGPDPAACERREAAAPAPAAAPTATEEQTETTEPVATDVVVAAAEEDGGMPVAFVLIPIPILLLGGLAVYLVVRSRTGEVEEVEAEPEEPDALAGIVEGFAAMGAPAEHPRTYSPPPKPGDPEPVPMQPQDEAPASDPTRPDFDDELALAERRAMAFTRWLDENWAPPESSEIYRNLVKDRQTVMKWIAEDEKPIRDWLGSYLGGDPTWFNYAQHLNQLRLDRIDREIEDFLEKWRTEGVGAAHREIQKQRDAQAATALFAMLAYSRILGASMNATQAGGAFTGARPQAPSKPSYAPKAKIDPRYRPASWNQGKPAVKTPPRTPQNAALKTGGVRPALPPPTTPPRTPQNPALKTGGVQPALGAMPKTPPTTIAGKPVSGPVGKLKAFRELVPKIAPINKGPGPHRDINCPYTTHAVEQTLKTGKLMKALPQPHPNGLWFLETAYKNKFSFVSGKKMIDAILKAKEGRRVVVYVEWQGGKSAHVFNGINHKGTVIYLDGQTGTTFSGWSHGGKWAIMKTN